MLVLHKNNMSIHGAINVKKSLTTLLSESWEFGLCSVVTEVVLINISDVLHVIPLSQNYMEQIWIKIMQIFEHIHNTTLIYNNINKPMSFASLSDNLEDESVVSALPSSSVSITGSVDC